MENRSEGFPRTGYLLPARGAPGVSPDVESCWDVAAAVAAASHLEVQVDILAGESWKSMIIAKSKAPDAVDRPVSSSQYVSAKYHGIS